MKKQFVFRILVGMLALLLMLSAVSCDSGSVNPTTPATTTTTPPNGGPAAAVTVKIVNGKFPDGTTEKTFDTKQLVTIKADDPPAGKEFSHWTNSAGKNVGEKTSLMITTDKSETYTANYIDMIPKVMVSVVNGVFSNGQSTFNAPIGEELIITAKKPTNGYAFSHWEDENGNVVSQSVKLAVTPTEDGIPYYKAYYDVHFAEGDDSGQLIMTDLAKDWQQGGTNGDFTEFASYNHRVSFAKPFFMAKDSSISVSLPDVSCPEQGIAGCRGNDSCGLTAALLVLTRNEGSNTGNLFTDYTIVKKSWNNGGFSYTATEDFYVMVTVKHESPHGSYPFSMSSPAMQDVVVSYDAPGTSGKPIGAHWNAELEDGISKIEAIRAQAGGSISEFFWLTDTHWFGNAQFSPALITYLSKELDEDFVVFGGDVITKYNDVKLNAIEKEVKAFFYAFEGFTKYGEENLKIMTTLGNHDRNRSSKCPDIHRLGFTEEESYKLYYERMEKWGVTVEGDANRSYYDDTENKVRYIQFFFAGSRHGMLEDRLYVDGALNWAEEHIRELDEDWTVVLFTHGFFCDSKGASNEITAKDVEVAERILTIQKEAKAEIALWVVGHVHTERNEILATDDKQTTLRIVSTYADANTYVSGMKGGTVNEQSFLFFQVDKAHKTVYGTRFGFGDDLVLPYGDDLNLENESVLTMTDLQNAPRT